MSDTVYYKITNENENHKGFQYKDELNVLPEDEPFAETGGCVKGGLYFTNLENIHHFYNYGVWLREVRLQPDDPKFKMVKDDSEGITKWRSNMLMFGMKYPLFSIATVKKFNLQINIGYLVNALHSGDLDTVDYLFTNYEDIVNAVPSGKNVLFRSVVKTGSVGKVKCLHEKFSKDKKFKIDNDVLVDALNEHNYEIVEYLVQNGAPLLRNGIMKGWGVDEKTLALLVKHFGHVTVHDNYREYYDPPSTFTSVAKFAKEAAVGAGSGFLIGFGVLMISTGMKVLMGKG